VADPKPFASLSSGLLARKGAARPAMRPQGFGQGGASLEDLGWNDMGFEPPKAADAPRDSTHDGFGEDVVEHPRVHPTGLTPVQSPVHSPVHSQQAEIADRFGVNDEGDEEVDETAELYDPEAEAAGEPEEAEGEDTFEPYEAEAEAVSEPHAPEPEAAPEHYRFEAEPAPESCEFEADAAEFEQPPFEPAVPAVKRAVAAVTPNPAPRRAPKPRSAPGTKDKAAFTLRLDPSRHLKLRLAAAVNGRSAQQIVTDALDSLLQHMPELEAMAETAKRKG
jgi:hypothetical protein